jgi:PAS domain S-box-containing protein
MKKSENTGRVTAEIPFATELQLAQKRLLFYTENTSMGFIEWDDQLHIKIWSKQAETIFGCSEREFRGLHKNGYSQVYADDLPVVSAVAQQLLSGTIEKNNFQHRNYTRDGQVIWCEWFNSVLRDKNGKVTGIISQVQDITAQKKAAEKIITTSHLYALISQINQTITHSKDEQTVLKAACHIAVEFGKFKMAWIGGNDELYKNVALLDNCGLSAAEIALLSAEHYESGGPVARMVQTGHSYAANDLGSDPGFVEWRRFASRCGWGACIVLPIKRKGRVVAAFNLVAAETDFFTPEVITLLQEAAGDISFALALFEEEKYRKQLTDQALHSALRLKQAQAIAHVGSWEIDFSSGVLVWSEEARRIYGLSPDDHIQTYQAWLSYIHPDDLEQVLKATRDGEETLTDAAFFHRIVWRDGTVRDLYSRAEFEFDAKGKPVGLYGIAHDITEIKAGEKALAQSEANLRQIVDLLPESIFARNIHGNYLFVNQSFADLNECGVADLIGQPLTKTIPASRDAAYFLQQDATVIASGERQIITEYPFTDYQEHARLFRIEKVPLTIAGSNEKAVLGIMMDITEQKRSDTERAKMTADIVQRNTDLEQFSYMISHNLRSSVANIIGITDLLQAGDQDAPDEKLLMGNLSFSVNKLDEVILDINHILNVNNKADKQKEWVRFPDLLQDVALSLAGQIKDHRVKLMSDFSAAEKMLTLKSYFYSIFLNLVSNSIKYRRPGVRPAIHITSERLNGGLHLIFKDNGMGIDLAKYGGQVFGLYQRFHSHAEGKGMGLYLVKTEVESLGGKISVSSMVNEGTVFRIEFGGKKP